MEKKCTVTVIFSLCLFSLNGCSTVNEQLTQNTVNGLASDRASIWHALSEQFKVSKRLRATLSATRTASSKQTLDTYKR